MQREHDKVLFVWKVAFIFKAQVQHYAPFAGKHANGGDTAAA
jgi:hypothetical protein